MIRIAVAGAGGRMGQALIEATLSDPELALVKRRLGPAFQAALREAIDGLPPRDRVILRMHLVDGLSIDRIAQPYGVHRATAARWLADVREAILVRVHERLATALGDVESDQLKSLGRLVASQLHLSLARLEKSAK